MEDERLKEIFGGKVKLIKVFPDGTEKCMDSGYVKRWGVGESIYVGSISSGNGWFTTPMQSYEQISDDEVQRLGTYNHHGKRRLNINSYLPDLPPGL